MRRLSTSGTEHATHGSTSVRNAAAAAAAAAASALSASVSGNNVGGEK